MPNTTSLRDRMSLRGGNRLKLGLFGANCSSGRAVTKVPERWSGTWPDNLRLARMADAAGIDFMLPIGRWNEDEFKMFGMAQREHAARYDYAQEWIEAIKLIWSQREDFDFDGRYI